MAGEEVRGWCALLDSGIDAATIRRLVSLRGGACAALDASDAELRSAGLKADQVGRLRDAARDKIRLARQWEEFERHAMSLRVHGTPGYPTLAAELSNPPPALFLKGELLDIDDLAIAMVGPRLATSYGLEVARRLAQAFSRHFTIVSGAAVGIDSACHTTAMELEGRTLAVLGCGIDQDYPQGTSGMRAKISRQGALVSQFTPLTKPETWHFPQRNYVLAGLALAVVVVEASEESGALVTAHAAVDEGRPVFAVPGDITRKNSRGSNALLRSGASPLTAPEDLLEELQGMLDARLRELASRRSQMRPGLPAEASTPTDPLRAELLAVIAREPRSYHSLLAEFVPGRAPMGDFAMALLQLELAGSIKQMPGRVFCARA